MSAPNGSATPDLEFARKYTPEHAWHYFEKHRRGRLRLSNWREQGMARRALTLAGNPASVLDIPCGTGRFWATLAENPNRTLFAADLNQPMLDTAARMRPPAVVERIERFQASAFEIPKPDGFVECAFCMRLIHHLEEPEHRLALLRELARVAAKTVVISLWIDGNYQAWRWTVKSRRKTHRNRFMIPRAVIEREFAEAGLGVVGKVHFLRFHSMWAAYVLRKR